MIFTFAELFAGAGGLSMGLELAGWESVSHAEIEPHARAVLRQHWPAVELVGDVSMLNGACWKGITLLSGGSPCQDLSVAGRRKGMAEGSGTRSSLFYEQVRLWQESEAPYFLWENVLGAFSSNLGRDFAHVLSSLVGCPVTVPASGWRSSGVAAGPAGVAAWRVLDAQYFGVPQRRRRVFVLGARTGGVDPAEVLALSEGLSGHPPSGREAGEGTPASIAGSTYAIRGTLTGRSAEEEHAVVRTYDNSGHAKWTEATVAGCLRVAKASDQHIAFGWQNSHHQGDSASEGVSPSLDRSKTPAVVTLDTYNQDASQRVEHSLRTGGAGDSIPAVFAVRTAQTTANGHGIASDVSHTLDGANGQALLFTKQQYGRYDGAPSVASTLGARDHPSQNTDIVVYPTIQTGDAEKWGSNQWVDEGKTIDDGLPSVTGAMNGLRSWSAQTAADGVINPSAGRPRRLTPLECERLMGWKDGHTAQGVDEDGNVYGLSDSARYKLCGNGVASPVAAWIGLQLRAHLESA